MADKSEDTTLNESAKNDTEHRSQTSGLNTSTLAGTGTDDLTDFVHNILKSTQSQFETMSNKIINRIDDVTRRVDELEKSINELMSQAGVSPE